MSAHKGSIWTTALAAIAVWSASVGFPQAQPQRVIADAQDLSLFAIQRARFAEPLVAMGPTAPAEDEALARAISSYEKQQRPDDFSSLVAFLDQHPHSNWAPAVNANLGLSYLHYGYFSKAREAWERAWAIGRSASDPRAKALIDRAVGELLRLEASLGNFDRVASLFVEVGSRPVSGSATELVQVAREALALVDKDPRHLFNCGPLALQSLMRARGLPREKIAFLQWHRVGSKGTNLAELEELASRATFESRLVLRSPGGKVPVPSVVHWKVGHFSAIVREENGRFQTDDWVSRGRGLWVTREALDAEASGYFLVPRDAESGSGWNSVAASEAGTVWGKGPTVDTRPGDNNDPTANGGNRTETNPNAAGPGNRCPMCAYDIKESGVSVTLSDQPVGYTPPIGPSATVILSYNQRESGQPAGFRFFNIGQKWTLNWLNYLTDDPNAPATVRHNLPGGGSYTYSGYDPGTGRFANQTDDGSILVRTAATPITYQRRLADGGIEIYSLSNGNDRWPRWVFLTQIIDPQGNALTFTYDTYEGQPRLTTVTDAVGRQTTLSYGIFGRPLLVSQITDPFGRSATLTYDGSERLTSITDVLGLTSSFTYDANSLVNSMTTPYGTTTFVYTAPGTAPPRFVQVTDPMSFIEREEWREWSPPEPSPIPASDPLASVPTGMPYDVKNDYLQYRNSFHWDKEAYLVANCPTGSCDYTKARISHFTHYGPGIKDTSLESVKYPLENRIWYAYPGQADNVTSGTYVRPTAVGRVLDDGTTQLREFSYDEAGYFNLTQMVDPLGRTTNFSYSNQIDLQTISQVTAGGSSTIAQFTYNTQHRPLSYVDAAGQLTTFTYNSRGQLASVVNPLGQTTAYAYDASHNLSTVTNANGVIAATYTYDSFARVRTFTDSEGWTVTYDYDAADRITRKTYPDATFESYTYNRLDLVTYTDRQGRTWTYAYDANRRLTSTTDPGGSQTQFGYNRNGQVTSLTDPKTNVTQWFYDVQGRLTSKRYPDTSTVTYAYETTTSRLKSVTDALAPLPQVKTYAYANDNRLTAITYTGAVNPTPNVGFTYDPYFPRLASMTDGTGTRQYAYVPVGALGALQLQQESGPLANSAIASAYDELGRLSQRTVQGAGAETFQYDALGRLSVHANDLGSFALGYLGQTDQITSRQRASSTLATTWSYLGNANDRRLAGIANTGLTAGQFSNFTFTTTPENFITGITEASDAAAVYPTAGSQTAAYNTLNQLTNLSGQARTYDANGNLLSDGQRTYAWDAENRLVGIGYPGVSGKATAFTYDGLDRRSTISSTPPGGGSATVTSYLWCGDAICQVRNAGNATTRSYYDEGEYLPGTPAQTLYYGIDQIGSVRRVFASTSSATAYSYDPYGVLLPVTAPETDFVYAGMFYNADSGLFLTNYRAYDPVAGRWLSRDPLGEMTDLSANLYPYVGGNPIIYLDSLGLDVHHWVPKSIFERANLPPEAFRVFTQGVTGDLSLHQYDAAHRLYNAAARELWERLLKENNIDPSKMTHQQAEKILREFKRCSDPRMKPLQNQIMNRALKGGFSRMPIPPRGSD